MTWCLRNFEATLRVILAVFPWKDFHVRLDFFRAAAMSLSGTWGDWNVQERSLKVLGYSSS